MKKILKERVFLTALISLTVTILCSVWFYTSCGIRGLMTWHLFFNGLFKGFFAVCLVPVIAIIPWFICKNKTTKIISYVFSGIAGGAWLLMFLALSVMNTLGEPASNLNLLKASDPLPVTEVSSEDTSTPIIRLGFGSDPHWGASHENVEARYRVLDGLASSSNDAVFLLGDIAEMGILSDYPRAIADLESHLGNIPLRVLPGNHDTIVCALPHFKKMFHQKDEPDYYRMDGGSVHILVIRVLWDAHEFSQKQEKWLIKQLEEIPQDDTVIVLTHCYLYGSGYYDELAGFNWGDIPSITEWICPILEKYNVDLAVNGHNHFFEYLENGNTAYSIVGTMGGKLDENLIYTSPYSKWQNNTDFGWLEATVYTDRIELEFINDSGKIIHTETKKTK